MKSLMLDRIFETSELVSVGLLNQGDLIWGKWTTGILMDTPAELTLSEEQFFKIQRSRLD